MTLPTGMKESPVSPPIQEVFDSRIMRDNLNAIRARVRSKAAVVGVFGAGYVGLPLACAFAAAGFKTIAGDTDPLRIAQIRAGIGYVEDPYTKDNLARLVSSGNLEATIDLHSVAALSDFSVIAVPTPLTETDEPDLSCVIKVAETIADELRAAKFVILESSIYPGATDEIIKPVLERQGLRAGYDFGLAYSPERIDYGNATSLVDIPKVVGGENVNCTEIAAELYSQILRAEIISVSNIRTAEATKMLENTYRYVNIALINELAIAYERLGVDIFETIKAAATKPFGFQAFYPGPGVGGHCIPKDPHYLNYKVRQLGMRLEMVELSTLINEMMVPHIIQVIREIYSQKHETLQDKSAVILGLAFKPDVSDTRRTPSVPLAEQLGAQGAQVRAYDPFVKKEIITKKGIIRSAATLEDAARNSDLLILITAHAAFKALDFNKVLKIMHFPALIFDARGLWSRDACEIAGFQYVGLGRPNPPERYPLADELVDPRKGRGTVGLLASAEHN